MPTEAPVLALPTKCESNSHGWYWHQCDNGNKYYWHQKEESREEADLVGAKDRASTQYFSTHVCIFFCSLKGKVRYKRSNVVRSDLYLSSVCSLAKQPPQPISGQWPSFLSRGDRFGNHIAELPGCQEWEGGLCLASSLLNVWLQASMKSPP